MKLNVIKIQQGYIVVNDIIGKAGDIIYNKLNNKIAQLHYKEQENEHFIKVIATDLTFKLESIPQFDLESNTYTEEDLIKLVKWLKHVDNGTEHYNPHTKENSNSIGFSPFDCFTDDIKSEEELVKYYIKSLNQPKELVAIEVEESFILEYKTIHSSKSRIIPKIVDNKLIVTKYYYE